MSPQPNMRVRLIKDDEKPMLVDPAAVGCGFLLFPKEMAKILQEAHVHQALQTNKTELWAAVRRHNPSIPVHLMTTNKEVEPGDAVIALNHLGRYPGYTIALDPMQLSPDGGKTVITIYAGLNWKSNSACGPQEVIVAGPQKLLPGKPASAVDSEQPSESKQPWSRLFRRNMSMLGTLSAMLGLIALVVGSLHDGAWKPERPIGLVLLFGGLWLLAKVGSHSKD